MTGPTTSTTATSTEVPDEAAAETPSTGAPGRFTPARLFSSYGALLAIAILALVMLVWAPGALSPFRLGILG